MPLPTAMSLEIEEVERRVEETTVCEEAKEQAVVGEAEDTQRSVTKKGLPWDRWTWLKLYPDRCNGLESTYLLFRYV